MSAPVALFAYKRLDKLQACLNALEKNTLIGETDLFIFSDGAKGNDDAVQVNEVRDYLRSYAGGFKKIEITESSVNRGLANSIIAGVTKVINEYGKVIVVEDDLITASDFLMYMNKGLDFYKDFKEYGSISAYTYALSGLDEYERDIYVTRKGECWGWATWNDRWEKVDWNVSDFKEYMRNRKRRKEFDSLQNGIDKMLILQMKGKIDSWAVRWCYHLYKNQLLTVYPKISRVNNIGFDGSGTHCTADDIYKVPLNEEKTECKFERLGINNRLEKETALFERKGLLDKVMALIRKLV